MDYGTKDRSSGPVQFERDPAEAVEADPFGLDQIISEVSCHPLSRGPDDASFSTELRAQADWIQKLCLCCVC